MATAKVSWTVFSWDFPVEIGFRRTSVTLTKYQTSLSVLLESKVNIINISFLATTTNGVRKQSNNAKNWEEVNIPVPWGHVAGNYLHHSYAELESWKWLIKIERALLAVCLSVVHYHCHDSNKNIDRLAIHRFLFSLAIIMSVQS